MVMHIYTFIYKMYIIYIPFGILTDCGQEKQKLGKLSRSETIPRCAYVIVTG